MRDVLVFFNSQPAELVRTIMAVTTIIRHYPDGREKKLRIASWLIPLETGEANEVFIAADRELSREDVISAARRLAVLRKSVAEQKWSISRKKGAQQLPGV